MRHRLCQTREAGSPPLCHDLIDVERGEARRRPLEHGRVGLGDLDVQRGDTTTHGLKTAKALGLTISPTLLARADEIIE